MRALGRARPPREVASGRCCRRVGPCPRMICYCRGCSRLGAIGSAVFGRRVRVGLWRGCLSSAWWWPRELDDGRWVKLGVGVLVLEFVLIHSGAFVNCFMTEKAGWERTQKLIGLTAFYSLFGVAVALAFQSWWIFGSFVLVMRAGSGRSLPDKPTWIARFRNGAWERARCFTWDSPLSRCSYRCRMVASTDPAQRSLADARGRRLGTGTGACARDGRGLFPVSWTRGAASAGQVAAPLTTA